MSKNLKGSSDETDGSKIKEIYNNRLNWLMKKIDNVTTTLKTDDRKLVMSQQNSVEKMLREENNRLLEKKKSIDMARDSQNRLITLNENYNKRSMEYLKMIIVVAISLASIALAKIFHLPNIVLMIIYAITISFTLFFCLNVLIRIRSRDNIYYDEIVLGNVDQPKSSMTNGPINSSTSASSSSSFIKCYGSDCCSSSTAWDASIELCVPKTNTIEKMTTKIDLFTCNGCKKTKGLKEKKKSNDYSIPYQPSEIDLYTKI